MDTLRNISYAALQGACDSVKGIGLLFCIDSHLNRIDENPAQPRRQAVEGLEHNLPAQEERRIGPRAANAPVDRRKNEMRVAKQIIKCCALNGGFAWLSILIFDYALLPTVQRLLQMYYGDAVDDMEHVWERLSWFLTGLFEMLWVLPIFLLSKIVNSIWFQDIANEAFKFRKGRPQLISNYSKLAADFLFSMLVQFLFLSQSMALKYLPFNYVGMVLNVIHLSLLYSLYSFEYKWFNMGWELHKRLNYIESNWPYFLGFGFPLAFMTSCTNSTVVGSCIFSMFFPLFILSGTEAQPVVGACETPLRLFSLVIAVANVLFYRTMGALKPATDTAHVTRLAHNRNALRDRAEHNISGSSRSSSHASGRSNNLRMR